MKAVLCTEIFVLGKAKVYKWVGFQSYVEQSDIIF